MPVVTGKTVGSQNVAKAGGNNAFTSAALGNNTAVIIPALAVPGLPKLTWLVRQNPGALVQGATFQPQVAIRRDEFNVTAILSFINVGPPALLVPGQTAVFEFNLPVQEMRALVTTAGAGNPTAFTVYQFASG